MGGGACAREREHDTRRCLACLDEPGESSGVSRGIARMATGKRPVAALAAIVLAMCAVCVGCAGSGGGAGKGAVSFTADPEAGRRAMAKHFHFRPAVVPRGAWLALLPGASGLKVFDDEEHYFRAAEQLSASGFDVIVIDYKAAYRAAPDAPDVETGDKIGWVLAQAVQWARENNKIGVGHPGAAVAWSLGAEGLWGLVNDRAALDRLGVRAAAAYYPSNEDERLLRPVVPLLVLTGEKDDVTESKVMRSAAAGADPAKFQLVAYPGAMHGFDITSLAKPRKVSLIPIVGPTATFGYDPAAAEDARRRLAAFLTDNVK